MLKNKLAIMALGLVGSVMASTVAEDVQPIVFAVIGSEPGIAQLISEYTALKAAEQARLNTALANIIRNATRASNANLTDTRFLPAARNVIARGASVNAIVNGQSIVELTSIYLMTAGDDAFIQLINE